MKRNLFLTGMALMLAAAVTAQPASPQNWHHLSPASGYPGIGSEALYQRLSLTGAADTVIVAVIDSGVDYEHEDLKSVMWVNVDEIPGNGLDDDGNGYIDDIHGWNFIGNAKGENIYHDNLEATRLYAKFRDRFEGKDPTKLKHKEKEEYALYQEVKEVVDNKRNNLEQSFKLYEGMYGAATALKNAINKDHIEVDDLKTFESDDPRLARVAEVLAAQLEMQGMNFNDFYEEVKGAYDYFNSQYSYNYNVDFEPRPLVNDNYDDKEERVYGNNDVRGPDAFHGTFVAGLIGAARRNGIGIDGVAPAVKIMSVRTVPDGDERDKDVANAIRYAVDNGASIINMSFGKGYSPYKDVVDKAVKYAMKHDVLMVHAAGNSSDEITGDNNFPTDHFAKRGLFGPKAADNWLSVGALNPSMEADMVAGFSNYSKENVDVFAPGAEIYSTDVGNQYQRSQGTSFAAPIVAGIAAVLRSYFPDLTAEEVKEIIMDSAVKQDRMVTHPETGDVVPFSDLSVTGGLANLEKAVELAIQMEGQKKGKKGTAVKVQLKKGEVVVP